MTVTATDTTGASGSASFTWTVSSGSGGGCTAAQLLGNPGFETGTAAPWTATAYAGQTITLKFTGSEDSSRQTSFVIDDTASNVS